MKAKLTTKGIEATLEALAQQGADVDAALAEGMDAGGKILLDEMLARVPRDTGNLADNLGVIGPLKFGNVTLIYVGINRNVPRETAIYGAAMEYGTARTAAQPYIRPAIDNKMTAARRALRDVLARYMGGGQ